MENVFGQICFSGNGSIKVASTDNLFLDDFASLSKYLTEHRS